MVQHLYIVSAGVKQLKEVGVKTVHVDPCGDAEGKFFGHMTFNRINITIPT